MRKVMFALAILAVATPAHAQRECGNYGCGPSVNMDTTVWPTTSPPRQNAAIYRIAVARSADAGARLRPNRVLLMPGDCSTCRAGWGAV